MRWPLKLQILLPMTAVMVCALAAVTAFNASQAVDRATRQIESQLQNAARTLATTDFPLTRPVLEQVSGLSGAEYVLANRLGDRLATSRDFDAALPPLPGEGRSWREISLGEMLEIDGQKYFHSAMSLPSRRPASAPLVLHILYPDSSYQTAWREAVVPPLFVGGIALAGVTLLATVIASHVSGRMRQLQSQVDRIADGDFQSMELPPRNDEVFDLAQAVNRMAEMLAQYEEKIRRNEQLRTLGQIGGGIAHQLRNSVTGCRMALQLHRQSHSDLQEDESLQVALNQLDLMEKFIQRFLSYRAFTQEKPHEVPLAHVVETVLPLVRASAAHAGIAIRWQAQASPIVRANAEALEQLVMNLLINAMEAISQGQVTEGKREVEITVVADGQAARIEVFDSGPGPARDVQDRLFDPLVTNKPDGTGLGLSVARDIARAFGGEVKWERRDGRTCFFVEFANYRMEPTRVEAACR